MGGPRGLRGLSRRAPVSPIRALLPLLSGSLPAEDWAVRLAKPGVAITFSIFMAVLVAAVVVLGALARRYRRMRSSALRSEEKFHVLFDMIPYACVIQDADGRFLMANGSFLEKNSIGSAEGLRGKSLEELGIGTPPDYEEAIRRELFARGRVDGLVIRLENEGGPTHLIYSARVIEFEGRKAIMAVTADITQVKRTEEALRASEERLRMIVDSAPIPLLRLADDGRFTINDEFTAELGWTTADIPDLDSWWGKAYPDAAYREAALADWGACVEKAKASDGNISPHEYLVACKDGSVRSFMIGANLLPGETIVSLFDISRLREAEADRERLQGQLLHSQKMEAIGRLAGGVAHDFNNMLAVILGHVEMARLRAEPGGPLRDDLEAIHQAATRSAGLTRQLLGFARKQVVCPCPLDLNATVEGMLGILRRLVGEDIALEWLPCADPWTVKVDPTQVDQVLANLAVNARDAIRGQGRISIRTDNASVKPEDLSSLAEPAQPGEYLRLTVSDDGVGMDASVRARLFEPFFTTKEPGKGTGMGLATVLGIVRQNGGFVLVDSEPGKGSRFMLHFPRCAEHAAARTERPAPPEAPPRGTERILVVEDEEGIRKLLGEILSGLGYEVRIAQSPRQAEEAASEERFDLLLTDLIMPGMDGKALAAVLSAASPGLRCLFMSGYTTTAIEDRGVEGAPLFLQKPFTVLELARKVREALEAGG